MNDQQLEDLKHFIDGRVGQAETRLEEKIDDVEERLERLRAEMLDGFAGIGEAVDEIDKQFDERITKLEQTAP